MRVLRSVVRLAVLIAALSATGCVERLLVVRSDPPGAAIYVDGTFRGRTEPGAPVEVPFETYGTRTLVARRPGCAPVRQRVVLDPPWYQYPVLDLVADVLWPGTIEDRREVEVRLERRAPSTDSSEVLRRADTFGVHEGRRP